MAKDTIGRRRHPSRVPAPTTAPAGPTRWPERKWAARAIRLTVFVVPIAASFGVAWVLSSALPVPAGFWERVARWLFVATVATVVMIVVQRLFRRLLPLAALLSLTLVFPDETPSRFGMALRGMSARRLDQRMAEVERDGLGDTPREAAETLLELVAALSRHDRLTRGHSERVRAYAVMIGEEMKLAPTEIDQLRWAALVHDVGKLAVPSEVLTKPGRLTDEEFALIRTHPGEGRKLVAPLAGWLGPSAAAVYEHHERWEGGGYPTGVPSERLALTSRIVSVADAFDVMTSARSYKQATSATAARAELQRCAGTQFDPRVVRAMMNISLGRLWRAMGPLSWLAQASLFPRSVAQAGPAVSTVMAALVSMVLTGLAGVASSTREQVLSSVVATPSIGVSPPPADVGDDSTVPFEPARRVPGRSISHAPPAPATSTTGPPPLSIGSVEIVSGPVAPAPPIGTTPPSTTSVTVTTPPPLTISSGTIPAVTATTTPTGTRSAPTTPTTGPPGTTPPIVTTPGTTPPVVTTPGSSTTTTTTTATTTTTTIAPTAGRFVLAAAGVGDQASQPVLDLVADRPVANTSLPNYDTDRNADPGLTIVASPTDLATSDPAGLQVWRLPGSVRDVGGTASLTLWLAPDGVSHAGKIQVRAGLFDCDASRTDCVRLSRDTARFEPTSNAFAPVVFDLSVRGRHQLATGHAVELRVAVLSGSSNDVWVGYDALATPSALVIGG